VAQLRELGWIEGRTIAIEYRWSEGRPERVAESAAAFAHLNVDVIVTYGIAVPIIRRATAAIPIVFAISPDPVEGGLVASLARPGGNVTGLSIQAADAAGKRIELLREVVPRLRRLAILADVGSPQAMLELEQVTAAARALGFEAVPLKLQQGEEIAPAFEALKAQRDEQNDALYVVSNALVDAYRDRIIALALGARLPTIFFSDTFVHAGALMSYGPNFTDLFRRAAGYVDRILRGTNPGDIPVQQPTKFELVINLKTAKALGLTMPPALLARADEVIE